MVFIDNLAYSRCSIGFGGLLLLYTVTSIYFVYKRKQKNFVEYLKGASVPLALIGAYMLISGLLGQFTWPLPGSYNILFYDPLVSFGIILLSFSLAIKYNVKLEYAGFLALLFGIMLIIYGFEGYNIGLTELPVALLGMYFLYGITGIFAYPVSMIIDRLPGFDRNHSRLWETALAIFWLALFSASLSAVAIGAMAIPAHLLSPP